ncbi:growth hormone inducible transmembrane protein [Trichuris trichiura]|uniref:Growth hormone inducible transmembrane protein n=1 Tax=Trichuris trichiura TaxID=36087 RepID=A0A077YYE4_TRITR|nr:growth hormone inducible transmembrane protein [Trichuris trichiura]
MVVLNGSLSRLCLYSSKLSKPLVLNGGNAGIGARFFATRSYRNVGQAIKRPGLQEVLGRPTTETPFTVGKLAVAGGAALGLSALCYYGLGLSSEAGAIEHAALWPQYVRDRVHRTYQYLGGGLVLTAASTLMMARSPAIMNLVTRNSFLVTDLNGISLYFMTILQSILGTIAAVIGTGTLCQSIPYEANKFGAKQLAWILHCGTLGAVIAPLTFLGGPLLVRAACYTAGVVGGAYLCLKSWPKKYVCHILGMSAVAMCAPNEKFLKMGGILGVGLGVVFVSSIGTLFLPPTSMLGASLYSIVTYGGLVLFSGFLLYDTQRVIKLAEVYPQLAIRPYDPINAQMGIYLDTINIFMRIAILLAGGGGSRRR